MVIFLDEVVETVTASDVIKQDGAAKPLSSSSRKRKRRSAWASGVIKKPRKSKERKEHVCVRMLC